MPENSNVEINVEEITCPITLDIFRDPVRLNDGYVYERKAILNWYITNGKSPITRETLTLRGLQRDYRLKELAARYRALMASSNAPVERLAPPANSLLSRIFTRTHNNNWLVDARTHRRQRRAIILNRVRWIVTITFALCLVILPNVCLPMCTTK